MPYIVGEIGINHNGSIELTKLLISLAKTHGLNSVKFQKRNPRECVPKNQWDIFKDTPFGEMKYIDYKERIEFGKREYDIINTYCSQKDIQWFASVWDKTSVDFMMQNYNTPFFKIPSACITDKELLKHISQYDIPVIVSTGMSTQKEIDNALSIVGKRTEYLLHCVSSYPTPDADMNMLKLRTLQKKYGKDYKIGFSNHSVKIIYTVQAYIMGAELLEFHITLDRSFKGTDHQSSIGPRGLEVLTNHFKSIKEGWGSGDLTIMESEKPIVSKLRKIQ